MLEKNEKKEVRERFQKKTLIFGGFLMPKREALGDESLIQVAKQCRTVPVVLKKGMMLKGVILEIVLPTPIVRKT